MSTTPAPTRTDLLKTLDEIHEKARVTVEKRNAAYAGAGDVFGNLNLIETLSNGKVSTEAGIVIRMADKISRLWSLVQEGAPESDEKLEDTLQDLLGYSGLLLLRRRTRTQTRDPLTALQWYMRASRETSLPKKPDETTQDEPPPPSKNDGPPLYSFDAILALLAGVPENLDAVLSLPLPIRIDPGFGRHIILEQRNKTVQGTPLYTLRFNDSLNAPRMRDYITSVGGIAQESKTSEVGNLYAMRVGPALQAYKLKHHGKDSAQRLVPGEEDPADGG
jgi:hypothetical protein